MTGNSEATSAPEKDHVQRRLDRISALDTGPWGLHAVRAIDRSGIDDALRRERTGVERRRSPLDGVCLLVKDNIEMRGMATTAGSLALVQNIARADAPIIARLRKAGAILLGKTNLSEWANFRSSSAIAGWSAVGGLVRNPHDRMRSASGSSSGSAVAVAAGFTRIAIGTETNGSITSPASVNGIVGFKPTTGLLPRTGIIPISTIQDTPGPMAATVRDVAWALDIMAGPHASDPMTWPAGRLFDEAEAGLRAGALEGCRLGALRGVAGDHAGVSCLFDRAIACLEQAGATVVDVALAYTSVFDELGTPVLMSEFHEGIDRYLHAAPDSVACRRLEDLVRFNRQHEEECVFFGQDIFERALVAAPMGSPDYIAAATAVRQAAGRDGIDRILSTHALDAVICPTGAPAAPIDAEGRRLGAGTRVGAGYLAAFAGYPHLTVPMGRTEGKPVGLSFMGGKWSDARILALGHDYEQRAIETATAAPIGNTDP
ncbi:MAG: amidase family protein [Gluconacetobacter sp.]|uniref:Amidase n=1 Tax=Gluconacetobacter dulcium TaxID=2729096 RepID=A0A7W4PGQ8_9PROT|nr:amidase family protein [Gluconacetobacter dulcium]MBB2196900.1 amidase [Gluconacetobacter dulcium]